MNATCWETARETRREESGARRLCVAAAELAAMLDGSIEQFVCSSEANLGHLETQLAAHAQEVLRQAAEAGAQKKAGAMPPRCPKCQRELTRQAVLYLNRTGLPWRGPAGGVRSLDRGV